MKPARFLTVRAYCEMGAVWLTIRFVATCIILLTAIYLLTACAPKPLVVEKVVTVTVKEKCIDRDLPTFKSVPRPKCDASGCTFALPDAANLIDNVEALKEWALYFLNLCKKEDVK
jgi:hypothetical protein